MAAFEIAEQTTQGTCVVRLSGDIDTAIVPELQTRLGSALAGGCDNVVLDLCEVVYADSSALGLLVWLDHRLGPAEAASCSRAPTRTSSGSSSCPGL